MNNYIDLRSDTVTKPSPEMRNAIFEAEVGDDVYGEDPTVNLLQKKVSEMFGKEAALFVPSGVMGNQVCIKTHTNPGDEIIADVDAHIFVYENAAPAVLSGVSIKTIQNQNGVITAEQIKAAIRPKAYYLPVTRLICLENTHGRSGGTIFPIDEIRKIYNLAKEENIKMHLDGARLWNAAVASDISLKEYAKYFDSILVCLSKGLGAPIGSLIVGDSEFIERARVYRKMFGGGMRQVGILAAAGIYAVENNIQRLAEDHLKAKRLAEELQSLKTFYINLQNVQTNMVIFKIVSEISQQEVLEKLKANGVLLTPEHHNSIRAVTHLDVTFDDIDKAISVFKRIFK
ncbi:MAG: Low-specificity L-threonine aldolase [Ignavibacteriae bacterium]|nr:MAG: Low-specificity L-threonine aldolase [Ignavibacteriota bacterium]